MSVSVYQLACSDKSSRNGLTLESLDTLAIDVNMYPRIGITGIKNRVCIDAQKIIPL